MDYDQVLANAGDAGIFACPPDGVLLAEAVQRNGLTAWQVDLAGVRSKEQLLERLHQRLPLPEAGAGDWEALDEALSEAVWEQSGGVALTLANCAEFARSQPREFETALEVFDAVAENCYDEDIPFWVFVEGVDAREFDLPMLDEIEA